MATIQDTFTKRQQEASQQIGDLYDKQYDSQAAQLKTAYDKSMSDATAAQQKIAPQYQTQANSLAAAYERNRRNANMSAMNSGTGSGTALQQQLGLNTQFQKNYSTLRGNELAAQASAAQNIAGIESDYQNNLASARSDAENKKAAALVEELRTEGSVSRTGTVPGVYEEDRYLVGLPLTSAATGETLGAVIVSSPRYDSAELGGQLRLTLFYTFLPCLLIGLVASLVVASRQFKTLSQMADAAQTLARGDFSVRVEVPRTTREVHDLAEGFNTMAEALEQTESMRQDFVAGVSHELKTPMTTIAGFVDGILDGTIPQEKHRQYLQTVSDEVHRLSRLVRNMLEASRLQEAQSQAPIRDRFDAVELVSRTLLTYEQRINDKGLDVDAQFPELEVPVSANADSITRVVSNLIDNAVKFSTPGSTLGIGVYTVQSKAYVYVRNEGPTIPAEELGRIFDRFHKTDKSRSEDRDGVGLGLYLVKSILNAHDEQITVTSQDGVTTFTFTLTLAG